MSDIVISAIIGGSVAAIVSGFITAFSAWRTRCSEERRQIRELAVQVALENFKIYKEHWILNGRQGGFPPLDVYLIHATRFVTALDGSLKTPEQIKRHMRDALAASDVAAKEINDRANPK